MFKIKKERLYLKNYSFSHTQQGAKIVHIGIVWVDDGPTLAILAYIVRWFVFKILIIQIRTQFCMTCLSNSHSQWQPDSNFSIKNRIFGNYAYHFLVVLNFHRYMTYKHTFWPEKLLNTSPLHFSRAPFDVCIGMLDYNYLVII